jgi:hypothetical protein
MSPLTAIYTIYGLLYTTFGFGVRHTGQAAQPNGRPVGITGWKLGKLASRKLALQPIRTLRQQMEFVLFEPGTASNTENFFKKT